MSGAARVAVLGGGQLAVLLGMEAEALGIELHVLDPDPACAMAGRAARLITAPFDDIRAVRELAKGCDALTLEIEAPPAALMFSLEEEGIVVRPSSQALGVLQDKLLQRNHFRRHGLPQPRFTQVEMPLDRAVHAFGAACVVKARRAGYDGKGVLVVDGADDPRLGAWAPPSLIEERIDLAMELGVMVVRGTDGQAVVYDPVEMVMDPQRHLLDALVAPARIRAELSKGAQALALRAVQSLEGVGAFGVELFVDRLGKLYINEVSPRVHNSGHHSLEACVTSQFANHLRAVLGWPLGSPALRRPAATLNLLGPEGWRGAYRTEGPTKALALGSVGLHFYGKAQSWPGRKLGHLTALADDASAALELAHRAKASIEFKEKR